MNAKELRGHVGPTGGFLDLERQQPRASSRPVQHLGKVVAADPELESELGDGFFEGVSVPSHTPSVVCDTIKSRGNDIAPVSLRYDAVGMTQWPQRPLIKAAVLAYRKEHKLNPEQMAGLLGVAPSYLHNVLYDKRVWPSLEVAQKLSEVLHLKLGEVVDDPGEEIPGASTDNSDFDRFMLKTMGKDLTELSDAQKQAGFQVWKSFMDGILNK